LIGEREAEAARVEVSRRLIAAADAVAPAPAGGGLWRRRALALATWALLPLGAVALYLTLGSPHLPGQPQAERGATPPERRSIAELVGRVESHLEENPEDGRGWEVLGPVYMRLGRYDDAVKARRNVLRLLGSNAQREADLGEALTGAATGIVTAEAREAFERAVRLDVNDFRARYFLGLAASRTGAPASGRIWRNLLATAPPDAGWTGLVREITGAVDPQAPPPGRPPTTWRRPAKLSPEQQAEMVRGMVARLAERPQAGWLRCGGMVAASFAPISCWATRIRPGAPPRTPAARWPGSQTSFRRVDELIKGLGLEG
jgi:cytochrome c-type biogenesis protein CcmH